MNILFRVDSSAEIGLGHLMRCLVLAGQYDKDHTIFFAAQDLEKNANQKVIDQGYQLVLLKNNSVAALVQTIHQLKIDRVVFDHYHINAVFEREIKEKTAVNILSLDDTYESHYCDILLNHNIYASAEKYQDLVPDFCEIRCGEAYTLIRDEFKELKINHRPIDPDNLVVFVSLGGADVNNTGLLVLQMLQMFAGISVNFATTSSNKNIDKLKVFAQQYAFINICVDCNVAELMNNSDFAIITPSVVAYEAMYLNLPFLAIQTANNQRYVAEYLLENGCLLGYANEMDEIQPLIRMLLTYE